MIVLNACMIDLYLGILWVAILVAIRSKGAVIKQQLKIIKTYL